MAFVYVSNAVSGDGLSDVSKCETNRGT